MAASRAVFIVAAKRTPFGTYGGKLRGISATDICKVAATAALEAGNVPPGAVDSVVIGNVAQVGGATAFTSLHYLASEAVPMAHNAHKKMCFNSEFLQIMLISWGYDGVAMHGYCFSERLWVLTKECYCALQQIVSFGDPFAIAETEYHVQLQTTC